MYIKQLKYWTVKCPDTWNDDLSNLSMKAIGILYFITYIVPDNYAGSLQEVLVKNNKDGRESTRTGMNELKEHGFLKLRK